MSRKNDPAENDTASGKPPTTSPGKIRVLVMRFSALGDVALLVPVFRTLEEYCPDIQLYLATQKDFHPLFAACNNVTCLHTDIYGRHKGLIGHYRMFHEWVPDQFDYIVDLHDVLRTSILSTLFKLKGKAVTTYDKRRSERREILRTKRLEQPQPHIVEQYLAAFRAWGAPAKPVEGPWIPIDRKKARAYCAEQFGDSENRPWIAIAPFSAHRSKEWHLQLSEALIRRVDQQQPVHLFCLAFGKRENKIAGEWKQRFPELQIIDGSMAMEEQLKWLAAMNLVITMDSANLHLSALVGTPTLSLWGATHPWMGFGPLGSGHEVLQASRDEAPWRPLSLFGKVSGRKKRKAERAMYLIKPDTVFEKVTEMLADPALVI